MRTEILDELLRSKSFREWSPEPKPAKTPTISVGRGQSFTYKGKSYKNLIVDERHYAPADLAKAWGVSTETVRQIFRTEPGVMRIGTNGDKRVRGYVTLRIPQSVAQRVHARLSAVPQTR